MRGVEDRDNGRSCPDVTLGACEAGAAVTVSVPSSRSMVTTFDSEEALEFECRAAVRVFDMAFVGLFKFETLLTAWLPAGWGVCSSSEMSEAYPS